MTVLSAMTAAATATAGAQASAADCVAMAGAVEYALFNETSGWWWRLDKAEQERIGAWGPDGRWRWATVIDVVPSPTAADRASVGVAPDGGGHRDHLLGLFTGDVDANGDLIEDPDHPPLIQLFATEIAAASYDPVDVAIHEIGHRLRYNDEHDNPPQEVVGAVILADGENPCPVCAVDDWLSMSERALFALRERSHMQHRIPEGLGGRIPEVRAKLDRAHQSLDRAELLPEVSGRMGEVRQLRGLIDQALDALDGDHLGPQDISVAHTYAFRAWDANVDLGHAYQLALRAPG